MGKSAKFYKRPSRKEKEGLEARTKSSLAPKPRPTPSTAASSSQLPPSPPVEEMQSDSEEVFEDALEEGESIPKRKRATVLKEKLAAAKFKEKMMEKRGQDKLDRMGKTKSGIGRNTVNRKKDYVDLWEGKKTDKKRFR